MAHPFIIGIFGPKRSGKGTIARSIMAYCTVPVAELQFSGEMKRHIKCIFGWEDRDDEDLKGDTSAPGHVRLHDICEYINDNLLVINGLPSLTAKDMLILGELTTCETVAELYRRALQLIGTEICRRRDETFWVNLAKRQAENTNADVVIFSDGRFYNELVYVRKYGVDIGVTRFDEPHDTHPSELEAIKIAKQCTLYQHCPDSHHLQMYIEQIRQHPAIAKLLQVVPSGQI